MRKLILILLVLLLICDLFLSGSGPGVGITKTFTPGETYFCKEDMSISVELPQDSTYEIVNDYDHDSWEISKFTRFIVISPKEPGRKLSLTVKNEKNETVLFKVESKPEVSPFENVGKLIVESFPENPVPPAGVRRTRPISPGCETEKTVGILSNRDTDHKRSPTHVGLPPGPPQKLLSKRSTSGKNRDNEKFLEVSEPFSKKVLTRRRQEKAIVFDNRFSLQGGLSQGEKSHFNLAGELIVNAKTKKGLLFQGAGKVDIIQSLKRYGFSVGAGYEPRDIGIFLFVDGLSYKFGEFNNTLHFQVRPTLRIKLSKLAGTLFFAYGIGDRYTGVDKLETEEYTISIYNKSLSYFGLSLRSIVFNRLFIKVDGIAATHGVYGVSLESGFELFRRFFITGNYQVSSFGKYPNLAVEGFVNTSTFGVGIQYHFGNSKPAHDLRARNIVPVFYPIVVSYEKRVEKEKEEKEEEEEEEEEEKPENLTVTLTGNPLSGKAPLSVDFSAQAGGGVLPYKYLWYFEGQDNESTNGNEKEKYTYYQEGTYRVYVEVEDDTGSKTTSNKLKIEVSDSGKYKIIAKAHEGANIKPSGTILAEPGGDYKFEMSVVEGYKIDRVEVDGKNIGAVVEYTFKKVDKNHMIEVWAKKDDGVKQYKILSVSNAGGYNDPEGTILVDLGETIKIKIIPDTDYDIKDVKVDGKSVGTVNEYTFSDINSDHIIESFFEIGVFYIEAIQNQGGSISPPGTTAVQRGGSQTYTITVDEGHELTDLLVDGQSVGTSQGNTYTFNNVNANHTIEPLFGQQTFVINASSEGGGIIAPSGAVSVVHGSSKTFRFVHDDGWEATELKVDGIIVPVAGNNEYTFENVTANHTIHIKFTKIKFTMRVLYNDGGSVTPGTCEVEYGQDKTFKITPLQSHNISDVKVDGGSIGPQSSYTFKDVKSNHILEVVFQVKTFQITVTCDEGSSSEPGTVTVTYGSNRTFSFNTIEGKYISDVKVDSVSKGEQSTWTLSNITADHKIELFSEWQTFEISETHDSGGQVTINGQLNPGKVQVRWGEDVNLRFETDSSSGKEIEDVTIDGKSQGVITSYTLKSVKENHAVHLATQWIYFTISETHGTGGQVTVNGQLNPGSVQVRWGQSVTCTFAADSSQGKEIDSVKIDGQNKGVIGKWTFREIKENHAIDLTTKWIYYTVSETHEIGGRVTINGQSNPGSVQVRWGRSATFNFDVNSNSGKEIEDVIIDGQSKGAITTYSIQDIRENHSCHLATKWIYYTIQVSYTSGGRISPSTDQQVKHGNSITFTIIPDALYMLDELKIDNGNITPGNSYTFSNVQDNHSIYASFKLRPLPKYDVIYGGADFAWKWSELSPSNGSGGIGPEKTEEFEQGQRFLYTYPASVKDDELPVHQQFEIPFVHVDINGVRYYSRVINIIITQDTYIRAYYYIDKDAAKR